MSETLEWSLLGFSEPGAKPQIGLMDTPFSQDQLAEIQTLAEAHGYGFLPLEVDTLYPPETLRNCEILCGYFPKKLLKNAVRLRWLQLPSAGADKYVDETIYPRPGVTLTNSSGAFGSAIAEQLLMGALMLLRRMPEYQAQQRDHVWRRTGALRFLRGSSVTVLGTGDLGGTFADDCAALGAAVRGVSRSGNADRACFSAVYPVERILEAVAEADIVAACLPLTKETEGLIDRRVFAAMKTGAIFLSVGRGKTVVQEDLTEALKAGKLSGAMLDVAEVEPMPQDCPLWDMENVIITPHVSGSDRDAPNAAEIFNIFMDNLRRYFAGETLRNIVDKNKGY